MKVLMINGSPHEKGCTYTALKEVAGQLEKRGIQSDIVQIGTKSINGCTACGSCKQTGKCIFEDEVSKVAAALDDYQAILIGSPVYYSSVSGQLVCFLDRLFRTSSKRMAGKVGAAVVSCRRGGATATFDVLNKYFSISNMVIATSQYWNQVHGCTPEQVRQDEEGLQTMRTLGENIAWLLKCLEAGRKAGVEPPQYEKYTPTSFIR